jgi:flagellar motor switch protein FliM
MFETNLKAKLYDLQEQVDRQNAIMVTKNSRIEELEAEVLDLKRIADRRSVMVRDFVKENRELKDKVRQREHIRETVTSEVREQIREEVKKEFMDAFERAITPTPSIGVDTGTRCF